MSVTRESQCKPQLKPRVILGSPVSTPARASTNTAGEARLSSRMTFVCAESRRPCLLIRNSPAMLAAWPSPLPTRVAVAVTPRYPAPRGEMLPVTQVPAARQWTLRLLGHFAPRRLLPIEYPQPACHFEPDHLLRNIFRPVSDMQYTPPSRKKPALSSLSLPLAPRPVLRRPMRAHGEPINHGLPGEPLANCG